MGNNQDNFQLQRITRRENTAKSFEGATFLTHTVHSLFYRVALNAGRSSQEKVVRPSICVSVRLSNASIVTKRKKDLSRFLHGTKEHLA